MKIHDQNIYAKKSNIDKFRNHLKLSLIFKVRTLFILGWDVKVLTSIVYFILFHIIF